MSPNVVKVTLAEALGLKPMAMLTLRKRGNVWWAYWRDAERRQRFRSTGKLDYKQAMHTAALMVVADLQALNPVEDKPRTDATIDEVIGLYEEFLLEPPKTHADMRPLGVTAHKYVLSTRRLAKLARVVTVGDLRSIANPRTLSAPALGITEGAYRSVMRGAGAGLFSQLFLNWLRENRRLDIANPLLGMIPPVGRGSPFPAWTDAQMAEFADKAYREFMETEMLSEYLLLMMCLGAGLRRSEATFARWSDLSDVGVSIPWRSTRVPKSGSSLRTIPLTTAFLAELRSYQKEAKASDFIIPDGHITNRTKPTAAGPKKRAERVCRRVMRWLRANGVPTKNPLHHLRRLCGSSWEQHFGLKQASYWLGHSDVTVTARHYVGLRPGAVAGWHGTVARAAS